MAIQDNEILKVVQKINMPDTVTAINVFYFVTQFAEAQEAEDIITALELWIESLYDELDEVTSDLLTMGDLVLYTYDTVAEQWDNEGTGAPDVTFTGISEMLPHGVCAMLRAYTVDSRTIGRKYFPGLIEGACDDGAWNATTITALAAVGVRWDNPISISENNDIVPGVFSTKWGTIRETTGTFVALADPAYQRRRRPGVGI